MLYWVETEDSLVSSNLVLLSIFKIRHHLMGHYIKKCFATGISKKSHLRESVKVLIVTI